MLAARVAVLSSYMGCSLSPEEILEDFRTFYYESALSAHGPTLDAMTAFVDEDHVLFGTDFPGGCTMWASIFRSRRLMEFFFVGTSREHANGELVYRQP